MVRRLFLALLLAAVGGCVPAARVPEATSPVTLRVVTYNIHHGLGMDGRVDLERIARVLEALAPDVIALQEVDERVARSGRVDQAARLGELLGMAHAFGSFMDYQGGRYGLALLSRHPIRDVDVVRLPDGNEPRVAVAALIEQPDGSRITAVSLHFDWVGSDSLRFPQAQRLAEYLDGVRGPWIVAGDFNDEPGSRTLELFTRRARDAGKPAGRRFTFSSTEPRKEIDFIMAAPAGEWRVDSVRVVEEPVASDHLPVLAVLRWQPRR